MAGKAYSLTGQYLTAADFDNTSAPGEEQNEGILGDSWTDLKEFGVGALEIGAGLTDLSSEILPGGKLIKKGVSHLTGIDESDLSATKHLAPVAKEWHEAHRREYSPERQAQEDDYDRQRAEAEGKGWISEAGATAKGILTNPRVAFGRVVQSAPYAIPGALAARGGALINLARVSAQEAAKGISKNAISKELLSTAASRGASTGEAIFNGMVGAGSAASSIQQRNLEQGKDVNEGIYWAIPAGLGSAAAGKVAGQMGDIETTLFTPGGGARAIGNSGTGIKGLLKGSARVAGVEAGEEAAQTLSENAFGNIGAGDPWNKGLAGDMVEGAMIGAMQGGALHGLTRRNKCELMDNSNEATNADPTNPNPPADGGQSSMSTPSYSNEDLEAELDAKLAQEQENVSENTDERDLREAEAKAQAKAEEEALAEQESGAVAVPTTEPPSGTESFHWNPKSYELYDNMSEEDKAGVQAFGARVADSAPAVTSKQKSPTLADFHAYKAVKARTSGDPLYDKILDSLLIGQREAGRGTYTTKELIAEAEAIYKRAIRNASSEEEIAQNIIDEFSLREQQATVAKKNLPMAADVYNAAGETFINGPDWTTQRFSMWKTARDTARATTRTAKVVRAQVPETFKPAPEGNEILQEVHSVLRNKVEEEGRLLSLEEVEDLLLDDPAWNMEVGPFNTRTWGDKGISQFISKQDLKNVNSGVRQAKRDASNRLQAKVNEITQRLQEEYPDRLWYDDELTEIAATEIGNPKPNLFPEEIRQPADVRRESPHAKEIFRAKKRTDYEGRRQYRAELEANSKEGTRPQVPQVEAPTEPKNEPKPAVQPESKVEEKEESTSKPKLPTKEEPSKVEDKEEPSKPESKEETKAPEPPPKESSSSESHEEEKVDDATQEAAKELSKEEVKEESPKHPIVKKFLDGLEQITEEETEEGFEKERKQKSRLIGEAIKTLFKSADGRKAEVEEDVKSVLDQLFPEGGLESASPVPELATEFLKQLIPYVVKYLGKDSPLFKDTIKRIRKEYVSTAGEEALQNLVKELSKKGEVFKGALDEIKTELKKDGMLKDPSIVEDTSPDDIDSPEAKQYRKERETKALMEATYSSNEDEEVGEVASSDALDFPEIGERQALDEHLSSDNRFTEGEDGAATVNQKVHRYVLKRVGDILEKSGLIKKDFNWGDSRYTYFELSSETQDAIYEAMGAAEEAGKVDDVLDAVDSGMQELVDALVKQYSVSDSSRSTKATLLYKGTQANEASALLSDLETVFRLGSTEYSDQLMAYASKLLDESQKRDDGKSLTQEIDEDYVEDSWEEEGHPETPDGFAYNEEAQKNTPSVPNAKAKGWKETSAEDFFSNAPTTPIGKAIHEAMSMVHDSLGEVGGVAVSIGTILKHGVNLSAKALGQVMSPRTAQIIALAVNTLTTNGWKIPENTLVVDNRRSPTPTKALGDLGNTTGKTRIGGNGLTRETRGADGKVKSQELTAKDGAVVAFSVSDTETVDALRGVKKLNPGQKVAVRGARNAKNQAVVVHELLHAIDANSGWLGTKALDKLVGKDSPAQKLANLGEEINTLVAKGKASTPRETMLLATFGWEGLGALADVLPVLGSDSTVEVFATVGSHMLTSPAFNKLLTFNETAKDAKALFDAVNSIKDIQNVQQGSSSSGDHGVPVQGAQNGERPTSLTRESVASVHATENSDKGISGDLAELQPRGERSKDSASDLQGDNGHVMETHEGGDGQSGSSLDTPLRNSNSNSTKALSAEISAGYGGSASTESSNSATDNSSPRASLLPYASETKSNSSGKMQGSHDNAQGPEDSSVSSVSKSGRTTDSTQRTQAQERMGGRSGGGNGDGGLPPQNIHERHVPHASPATEKVSTGIIGAFYTNARRAIDKRISSQGLRTFANNLVGVVSKTAFGGFFLRDLVQYASKLLPSANTWYKLMEESSAFRHNLQQRVADISRRASKLSSKERDAVNEFSADMTIDGHWAYYEPRVYKTKATYDEAIEALKPEPKRKVMELRERFNKLSPAAQQIVRDMFAHTIITRKLEASVLLDQMKEDYEAKIKEVTNPELLETLKKDYDDNRKTALSIASKSKMPYLPLRRFGDHLTVARSADYQRLENKHMAIQENLENETDPQRKAQLNKMLKETSDQIHIMEQNADHYMVVFSETLGEANEVRRSLESSNPGMDIQVYEKSKFLGERVPSFKKMQQVIDSFKNSMQYENLIHSKDASKDREILRKMESLAEDIYIRRLSEESGRKAELQRRKIAGFHSDMIENLTETSVGESSIIASMKYGSRTLNALTAMRKEVKNHRGEQQELAGMLHNEILSHHQMYLNPADSKLVSNMMQASSFYMLMMRPAYYLQNLTQPMMMSAPYMAKDFGIKAFTELGSMMKVMAAMVGKGAVTLEDLKSSLNQPGDEEVYQALMKERDLGRIDVGLSLDMGRVEGRGKVAHTMKKVSDRMQGWSRNVETINRVATFVTAFRLAKKAGMADPHAYASDVVYRTHGDYSGLNAPRLFATNGLAKLMTQFRKFQLIQISMMMNVGVQAFKGATKEERALGRRAMIYTLGVHFAMTGLKGLPVIGTAMAMLPLMFGDMGDDDEDVVRKAVNDKPLADFLLYGIPKLFGIDVSKKIGAGEMFSVLPFWSGSITGGKASYGELLTNALGPSASLGLRMFQGFQYAANGDMLKSMEQFLPNGMSDTLKAYRMGTQGITTSNGVVVLSPQEYKWYDMICRALGLPTNTETDRNRLNTSLKNHTQALTVEYSRIRRDYIEAYKAKDEAGKVRARREWLELGKKSKAMRIPPRPLSDLLKSGYARIRDEKRAAKVGAGLSVRRHEGGFIREMMNK